VCVLEACVVSPTNQQRSSVMYSTRTPYSLSESTKRTVNSNILTVIRVRLSEVLVCPPVPDSNTDIIIVVGIRCHGIGLFTISCSVSQVLTD
jgi:hypothetical protein